MCSRRNAKARSLCRPVRRIPRGAGVGLEDLPGALRQQQILGAQAPSTPVEVHAYADRIVIRQDGRIVAEHSRSFGRGETVYDPWHYVPVLPANPRLAQRAPFKTGTAGRDGTRARKLAVPTMQSTNVDILNAVLPTLARSGGCLLRGNRPRVHSADVVLNILPASVIPPTGHDPHPGRPDAATRADCRLCPLRQPPENHLMNALNSSISWRAQALRMKAAYDEIMTTAVKRQHEPQRIVGDLLTAEIRRSRRARSNTSSPSPSCRSPRISTTSVRSTPINQTLVNDLASGGFIAQQRNAVLSADRHRKTHLAIAIARSCIRSGARAVLQRRHLVNRLETETRNAPRPACRTFDADGYHRPRRTQLFALRPGRGQLLFHLVSKLYERTSIIVTTTSPSRVAQRVRHAKMTPPCSIA